MKISVILLIVACGVIAGTVVYLNRAKTAPAPVPVAESTPATGEPPAEKILVPKPEAPSAAPTNATVPAPIAAAPAVVDTNATAPTNAISQTVDALLAARGRKHEMFEQLRKDGQLDSVIAELQKRAAANPTDPEIPTTLGEAMLNKVKGLHDAGDADVNEMGILAMQADQSFNAALKIDPKNWEAQFVKYSSMYYWPASPERDANVAQQLSSLIDQQEGMPSQPQFANTYVVLGNQYQKMGKPDEAMATWQLGAQKFPGDPTLQQKIGGR
jgi:cytochrome c-type biogenesis protein CcmH/NrfG